MKKFLCSFAMVVLAALCFTGCSKGPDSVALDFQKSLVDKDFKKAGELCSKRTQPLIAMAASMGANEAEEMKGVTFEVVNTKIDGDKATVSLKNSKDGKTEDVTLVKEDGDWKVDINKEDKKSEPTKENSTEKKSV